MLRNLLLAAVAAFALAMAQESPGYALLPSPQVQTPDGGNPAKGANAGFVAAAIANAVASSIQRSGGTMNPNALLSLYLESAPNSGSLQDILKDVGAFYGFGGKADGGQHLLSGITSFNGLNTAGYTLAQWQALFAGAADRAGSNPVTTLTNEIDEVALQAIINTRGSYATNLSLLGLPTGYIRLTHAIKSGCFPLQVKGGGRNATQLTLFGTGLQDVWHHGTSDTACPATLGSAATNPGFGTHVEFQDFTVQTAGIANRAFDIVQGGDARVIFSNVYVLGGSYVSGNATTKGTGQFFQNGIRCQSCSNFIAADTYLVGPFGNAGAVAGSGLEMNGGATGSMLWRGGFIGGYHSCVLSYSGSVARPLPTRQNGDNEGLVFDGMQTTGCDDVYSVFYDNTPPISVPEYYIKNGQYGTTARHFINFNGASDVFIQHNLVYTNNPFGVGGGAFTSGSATVSGLTYLGSQPTVGEVITAPYAGMPAGTTIVSLSPSAAAPTSLVMSAPAAVTTGANDALSFQPTQDFTATGKSGSFTLTGVSGFANDVNGYMIIQKDGCVYGVPGVSGCDAITAVDGYNMTVTVATAPNTSGTINGSFHYPEVAPNLYQVNNSIGLWIKDQDIQMPPGDRMNSALVIANSKDIYIKDWQINDLGDVMLSGFYDQGGNKNLTETGTVFGPAFGANNASTQVSGAFASNSTTVRWGSYYKSLGCDLGTSGKVTCSGVSMVTLNTSNSQATASIILPNAFLNAPQIDATNGNFGVSTTACGPVNQTTPSAAAGIAPTFLAACSTGSGNNVQINWHAIGY